MVLMRWVLVAEGAVVVAGAGVEAVVLDLVVAGTRLAR